MDLETLGLLDNDIKKISRTISKSSRSVRNRLLSIIHDNEFVTSQVVPLYNDRPLVPNKRCGLWYVRPEQRADSCYFKSTDGHNTQWDFSVKRLNLHLIPLIVKGNGIIVVDSTRRGKKMPDALSKTIPIWCCCINAVIFGKTELHLPPETVSKIEYNNILDRIPLFVERIKLMNILQNVTLDKPLRPLWCFPGSVPYETMLECEEFHPVICCTASVQKQDGELHLRGFEYVQGAADDHELWCPDANLDDKLFWTNALEFQKLYNDTEVAEFICRLVEAQKKDQLENTTGTVIDEITVMGNTRFSVAKIVNQVNSLEPFRAYDKVMLFTDVYKTEFLEQFNFSNGETAGKIIFLPFGANKKFYKKFRDQLRNVVDHLNSVNGRILIACENGEDFSIGVLLCLICLEYDLNWSPSTKNLITKNLIKSQLINIINVRSCNPQRNILNSCNSVLM